MVSPRQVDREEVRRLAAEGAQIVDVLPPRARHGSRSPTIRPSVPLADIGDYFPTGADSVLVTTPDGILLGVVDRADVANRSEAQPADTARGMA